MPRLPYIADGDADSIPITAAIRARRGGKLLNLDRMLLNSPSLASCWNAYLGAVRGELALPPKLRELAICVVAVLNDAQYEFHHHAPELRRAGGTEAQLRAVELLGAGGDDPVSIDATGAFDATEAAVVALTIRMTRRVSVDDATFNRLRSRLANDQWVVELVGVIATYNMVSRFLVALGIEPE
jgi:AhpD family alkylhydroperoxidase